MWPRLGPVPVYGIFSLLGLALHFVVSWRNANRLNLRPRWAFVVSTCYLLGMIPGAKFLFHWKVVEFDPLVVFDVSAYLQGGLWGGLLVYFSLGTVTALLFARHKREVMDLVALCIPVPWAVSKLGCLLNGCCNGPMKRR